MGDVHVLAENFPFGSGGKSLKSVRIPAKKLLASGPKFLVAGHIANFQISPKPLHRFLVRPVCMKFYAEFKKHANFLHALYIICGYSMYR